MPDPEGSRRASPQRPGGTASVLFTDIVGSTQLMARLGETVFDKVRRDHFYRLREALATHAGVEVKNTGDGVMATFSSAVGAVACAVAMQRATARQAHLLMTPLSIRIGLSLGEVTFEGDDCFGVPVVQAARLVKMADSGQILTTAVVRAVAGGRSRASFVDVGSRELEGLPDPVITCEIAWRSSLVSTAPLPSLMTGTRGTFVGRDSDLRRLQRLWEEVSSGELRVALIGGEPGIGKTRLAAELAERLHVDGALILGGRCDEDMGVPYQPFVEALRHMIEHTLEDGNLSHRLGRYGGDLVRLAPELAERLSNLPSPLRSDPETERYRLFDAVAACLSATSVDQPVLLVLDDLQWATKPTLLLLRHLVRSAQPMRVLVIGTYRDTELGRTHPFTEVLADLRRTAGVERISLSGLDHSGIADYMRDTIGPGLGKGMESLARAIHAETEGNPFFMVEVFRHLIETRALYEHDSCWVVEQPDDMGIPESVKEVVGRRLSRLSDTANRALAVAAVVGEEFEPAVLLAATALDEDGLMAALDESVAARLLVAVPGPVLRHRFAHALVRTTLYEELSAVRRAILHRRVGEAVEKVHRDVVDEHLPGLVHHYARATVLEADRAKLVSYAARAGDRALAQLAHDEAARYYYQALEILETTEAPTDSAQRTALLISLGEAERRGGNPTHRVTLLKAARLALVRGDIPTLIRAALANSRGGIFSSAGMVDAEKVEVLEAALAHTAGCDAAVRARLLANLSVEVVFAPDRDPGAPSDEALILARQLRDETTLAHVLRTRYYTSTSLDTRAVRWADTAQFLAVATRLDDPAIRCEAYHLRARSAMDTGDIGTFDSCLDRAEQLAVELGQPTLQWMNMRARVGRLLLSGHVVAAEELAHEALRLGEAAGQPDAPLYFAHQQFQIRFEQGRLDEIAESFFLATTQNPGLRNFEAMLAVLYAELNRDDEARVVFERFAASNFQRIPRNVVTIQVITSLSLVAAHLHDVNRAKILQGFLAPYPEHVDAVAGMVRGTIAHYLGILAATLEDFAEAEARFIAAEAAHSRIGAPTWLARTRLERARMLVRKGEASNYALARDLLRQVLCTARELGLATVERRAVAFLTELE